MAKLSKMSKLIQKMDELMSEEVDIATANDVATLVELVLAMAQASELKEKDVISEWEANRGYEGTDKVIRKLFKVLREVED